MSQGFVFATPVAGSGLSSTQERVNNDAIGTLNAGKVAPINPRKGMPWLDTTGTPLLLKTWDGNQWVIGAEFPLFQAAIAPVRFAITPAIAVWTLTHNLNKTTVAVFAYDSNGVVLQPLSVDVSDPNVAVVTHAFLLAGSALVIG